MPLCRLIEVREGGPPILQLRDKKKKNVGRCLCSTPSGVLVRVEDTPALSTEWSASPD